MRPAKRYGLSVAAVGIQVWIVGAILLFWARWAVDMDFWLACGPLSISHSPSGVPGLDEPSGPNIVSPSALWVRKSDSHHYVLGIARYSYVSATPDWAVSWTEQGKSFRGDVYFDAGRGLLVCACEGEEGDTGRRTERLFAGPSGVGTEPNQALGRFVDPTWDPSGGVILDPGLQAFFKVDFMGRRVLEGPRSSINDQFVQIGWGKNIFLPEIAPFLKPPVQRVALDADDPNYVPESQDRIEVQADGSRHALRDVRFPNSRWLEIPVVGQSGSIYGLDPKTLQVKGPVAYLPDVGGTRRPDDLLAYGIQGIAGKNRVFGCAVGALSSDADELGLDLYDANGVLVWSDRKTGDGRDLSVRHTGRYILENLQPLACSLLCAVLGPRVEAGAGYRALCIAPQSLIAKRAHDPHLDWAEVPFVLVFFLLPALALAGFLTWRVHSDAMDLGLPKQTRTAWIAATLALGLVAYVTYRLTRPKVAQVTCPNCGRARRTDMDRCHRCKAAWEIPSLVAPTWRVMD